MRAPKKILCSLLFGTTAIVSNIAVADDKEKFNYSYIEGAYVHDNFDGNGLVVTDRDGVGNMDDDNFGSLSNATGSGGAGRLSFAIPLKTKNFGFHIVADYVQTGHLPSIAIVNVSGEQVNGIVDANKKEWRAAVGFHTKASEKFSFFAELGIVNNKVDFTTATLISTSGSTNTADLSAVNSSKTSVDAKVGFRTFFGTKFEVTGYGRYHGNGRLKNSADGQKVDFSGKLIAGAGMLYHFNKRFALGLDYEFGEPGRARLAARLSF